jgi:hypothetical protein
VPLHLWRPPGAGRIARYDAKQFKLAITMVFAYLSEAMT